jgi:50S ribosomal subunit-associated GTPase HflX
MEAVGGILKGLDLDSIPSLTVFNKMDRLERIEAEGFRNRNDAVCLSALTGEGTEALVARVGDLIRKHSRPH